MQANWLNSETRQQVITVGVIEKEFETSRDALRKDTSGIGEAREQLRGGVCWMYGVIAAESFLLVYLLWTGL